MDSFSFAHLNGIFAHKALCLRLMTDEKDQITSEKDRNSNHLHTF